MDPMKENCGLICDGACVPTSLICFFHKVDELVYPELVLDMLGIVVVFYF